MTALNVTVTPAAVWLSVDSAFGPVPSGMVTPMLSGDVEAMRRGTFADAPVQRPVVTGYGLKACRVGPRLAIAGTGHAWPMRQVGIMLEQTRPGLDEAVERGHGELRRILTEDSRLAVGAILLAGWSDTEDRALAYVLPMDGGLAQRLADGHMTGPLPDPQDPWYRALYEQPTGRPAGRGAARCAGAQSGRRCQAWRLPRGARDRRRSPDDAGHSPRGRAAHAHGPGPRASTCQCNCRSSGRGDAY